MKIRTRWIFTIILCLFIAIPLAACGGSPIAPNGTLESKNGVTVEGTFADGAALEAVNNPKRRDFRADRLQES